MKKNRRPSSNGMLHVLLIAPVGGGSTALCAWLGEHEGVAVSGPVQTIEAVRLLAQTCPPAVVAIDLHGLTLSPTKTVAGLKSLTPVPLVAALAHGVSATIRRRCREAQIDAVFDKTTELEALATWLNAARTARQ